MKVLTDNEIIVQKGPGGDQYYNAGGKIKDKLKGLVGSGKVQGVLAALGGGNNGQGGVVAPTAPEPKPSKPKGMSTGMKVGIGLGVAALVGIIIYVVVKKKKK